MPVFFIGHLMQTSYFYYFFLGNELGLLVFLFPPNCKIYSCLLKAEHPLNGILKEKFPEVKKWDNDTLFLKCMDMNGTTLMAVESGSQAEFEVWRDFSVIYAVGLSLCFPSTKKTPKRYPSGVRL